VPIGVPLFLIAALIGGQLGDMFAFGWAGTGYLAAAGILHFVWGRYWNYRAVKEMGANLSGAVQQISLVAALAFAMALLGEQLTILRVIGIVLVVGGPFIMTSGRGPKKGAKKKDGKDEPEKDAKADDEDSTKPPAFRPNILAGYVAGIMATLGYGMTPTLVRCWSRVSSITASPSTAPPPSGSRCPACSCSSPRCSATWRWPSHRSPW
jgi:uncharacterized membrane protein